MSVEIITKSNDLIHANFKFTLNEYRILMYAVAQINPKTKEFPKCLNIDVKEFAKMFDINVNGLYKDLKESIVKKFFKREITLDVGLENKKLCHWLDSVVYSDGKHTFELEFSNNVMPLLTHLKEKFTSYHIEQISQMKSIYAIRIYEYSILEINRQKADYCEFVIDISTLKRRLELEGKYKDYNKFKLYVLNKAKAEINTYSDLHLEYEEIKMGRAVDKIQFKITRKNGTKRAKYETKQEEKIQRTDASSLQNPKLILPTAEEMVEWIRKTELQSKLVQYQVSEQVTKHLFNQYALDRIERGLHFIHKKIQQGKQIANPAAYLVSAIKESYE